MKVQNVRTSRLRTGAVAVVASSVVLGLSACGSDDSSSESSKGTATAGATTNASGGENLVETWDGTGSLEGGGKEIVVFMPSGGLQFNAVYQTGAKAEAQAHGYKVRFFSNNYDQAEQDRQVQQYLATGAKPAGFVLYPPVGRAAKNSIRQLARVAPVVQGNISPRADPASFAGASHPKTGELQAEAYEGLLKKLEADGYKWRGPKDGVLFFNGPESLEAGEERQASFLAKAKADGVPVKQIGEENGMVDRQTGYKLANQSLSKYGDKFDVIWALNLTGAVGIAQALKERGRTPGKDVFIVSGSDCTGGLDPIRRGDVYSTVGESPSINGRTAVRSLVRLIAFGGYTKGEKSYAPTPETPELENSAPRENEFMPVSSIVGPESIDTLKIWGEDASQICPK